MSLQCKSYIKKEITAIKNVLFIVERVFYITTVLQNTNTAKMFYSLICCTVFTSLYIKANKIIIKPNSKDAV